MSPEPVASKLGSCPDGGTCHHECSQDGCFRVISCVPLGAAKYPGDRWPQEVLTQHRARFLAMRAARELAAYGARVRCDPKHPGHVREDPDSFLIAETMGHGALAFFTFQGEQFAVSIAPMINQDKHGPFFSYEPRPEGYGAQGD